MSQQGQNQGLSFDQMRTLLKDQNKYQTQRNQTLYEQQQANRPWAQRNPGTAMAGGLGIAGLSGLASGLFGGGGLWGKKERTDQVPMFSPEIMALKNQMGPQIWQQIMGGQFDFDPIEQLTRRGFQSKTMPSIMNRFNMGNNLNSSAQMGALGEAGAGLDQQLAGMRQDYGLQRQRLLASLMPSAMSPSFENVGRPRQQGGMEQGMNALLQMLPYIAAAL